MGHAARPARRPAVASGRPRHAREEVFLTVRITKDRVLLSEFPDWHSVFDRSLHGPPLPGVNDDEWEAILDPRTWRTPPVLQATMRELRAEDVVRAMQIRGRRRGLFRRLHVLHIVALAGGQP